MAETRGTDAPPFAAAEIEAMARDWITLWQSELAALAGDREAQEGWIRLLSLWAGMATALLGALPPARAPEPRPHPFHERADARAGTPPPHGAAPIDAAPDARDAALERLDRRLARLEERLAALERGIHGRLGAAPGRARPLGRAGRSGIPPGGAG